MLEVAVNDDTLKVLEGQWISSDQEEGVSYFVDRKVGAGGMAVAFFALRIAPDGEAPVVLKIMRPSFIHVLGSNAALTMQKETIALKRLNERVPSTPFVIRLIGSGSLPVRAGGRSFELPWIAVEYVQGGPAGTTLEQRVEHSITSTGHAFDSRRAAHAISCLSSGLSAVHEVGVIHRDLKPGNVLCSGFGDDEIFQIADFGVARPAGHNASFGGIIIGTPGYAPPEQMELDERNLGPWSDVFGLAAVVYFLLTGEDYFPATSPAHSLVMIRSPVQKSILDAPKLAGDLRARPEACRQIDEALARATAARVPERTQSVDALAAALLGALRGAPRARRSEAPPPGPLNELNLLDWRFTTRQRPHDHGTIRSAAWDGQGRCLALTDRGLAFWNGTEWLAAKQGGLPSLDRVDFVHRIGPGRWLVGGADATLAVYSQSGVDSVVKGDDPEMRFHLASGELDDITVVVGAREGGFPTLHVLAAGRWLRPLVLPMARAVTGLSRIGDASWLIVGRGTNKTAFAGIYSPLDWEVKRLPSPKMAALLACAANRERGMGVLAGEGGIVGWYEPGRIIPEPVPGAGDVTSAAVDAVGQGWIGGTGGIWYRASTSLPATWRRVSSATSGTAPVVSMYADVGIVLAVDSEGAILEGRMRTGRV